MISYGDLAQTNRDLIDAFKTELLYEGGPKLRAHIAAFISRHPSESTKMYRWRLENFAYENHLAHIIDAIVAALCENEIMLTTESKNDVIDALNDPMKTDLRGSLRKVITGALLHDEGVFVRLAFEEDRTPCFQVLPTLSVLQSKWDNDNDELLEVIVKEKCEDEALDLLHPERFYIRFEHYRRLSPGKTQRTTYKSVLVSEKTVDILMGTCGPVEAKEVGRATGVKILAPTAVELAYDMPILRFELGQNLHFGSNLRICAEALLRMDSAIDSATARCLNPIPYISLGPNAVRGTIKDGGTVDGKDRKRAPMESHDEHGFMRLLSDDKPGYLEPNGTVLKDAHDRRLDRVDSMYRTAFQMSQTIATLSGGAAQSGAAKEMDLKEKNIIISMIATSLKVFVKRFVMQFLAILWPGLPKTQDGKPDFDVRGLDFASDMQDRDGTVAELTALGLLEPLKNSKTFAMLYLPKRVEKLLDGMADKDDIQKIIDELEANFDQQTSQESAPPPPQTSPTGDQPPVEEARSGASNQPDRGAGGDA